MAQSFATADLTFGSAIPARACEVDGGTSNFGILPASIAEQDQRRAGPFRERGNGIGFLAGVERGIVP